MKPLITQQLRRITDRAGRWKGYRICHHDIFQALGVIPHCVEAANVLVAKFPEADAQEIAPGQQADKFATAQNRRVVNSGILEQSSGLGDRVIQIQSDNVLRHDVRNRVIPPHREAFEGNG